MLFSVRQYYRITYKTPVGFHGFIFGGGGGGEVESRPVARGVRKRSFLASKWAQNGVIFWL